MFNPAQVQIHFFEQQIKDEDKVISQRGIRKSRLGTSAFPLLPYLFSLTRRLQSFRRSTKLPTLPCRLLPPLMAMASLTLTPPTSKPTTLLSFKPQHSPTTSITPAVAPASLSRRELALSLSLSLAATGMFPPSPAAAVENDEYEQETKDVIRKVRATINMERSDPDVPSAVAELREASNSWVAKYRREKALLGRSSFRDMYSALNAVSGHYISFGPTAPIPVKRKTRILEEVDTAEKALLRGR